jgi:negative regulator of sigma-B (phosphoserine phosphatase)
MEATLEAAAFVRPCVGERLSGDCTLIEKKEDLTCAVLLDGLGHGPRANEACAMGLEAIRGQWNGDPKRTLELLHQGMRNSAGGVGAVCVVNEAKRELVYAGVGNTVARVLGRESRGFVSVPGTLGRQMREPRVDRFTLSDETIFLMHSDGISDRAPLGEYPEIRVHSVQTIVRTMVKRFGRTFDDVSCIAMRYSR